MKCQWTHETMSDHANSFVRISVNEYSVPCSKFGASSVWLVPFCGTCSLNWCPMLNLLLWNQLLQQRHVTLSLGLLLKAKKTSLRLYWGSDMFWFCSVYGLFGFIGVFWFDKRLMGIGTFKPCKRVAKIYPHFLDLCSTYIWQLSNSCRSDIEPVRRFLWV